MTASSPAGLPAPLLGAVLAGGESRRFGSTKALATFQGETLFMRLARALASSVPSLVVLIGDNPELARAVRDAGLFPLADRIPGAGPLGGIHTALELARERGDAGVLLLPCDMPLVPEAVPRGLALAPRRPGERALVASSCAPPKLHPLCARFEPGALATVRMRIAGEGNRSIFGLLEALECRSLAFDRAALGGLDPELAFAGANTPGELSRLEHRASSSMFPEHSRPL